MGILLNYLTVIFNFRLIVLGFKNIEQGMKGSSLDLSLIYERFEFMSHGLDGNFVGILLTTACAGPQFQVVRYMRKSCVSEWSRHRKNKSREEATKRKPGSQE